MANELLQVRDLKVSFPEKGGLQTVVDGISFDIHRGEIVGIVGESGSGKSMTALSIMGLLSSEAQMGENSQMIFNGEDLVKMDRQQRRKVQGVEMSMVFQEPMTSLNPVMKIGKPALGFCKTRGFSLSAADRVTDISLVNAAMDGGVFIE